MTTTIFASPARLTARLRCFASLLALALAAVPVTAGAQVGPPPEADSSWSMRHRFDTLGGACDTRGWTAENRVPLVFAHVSDRFVVNSPVFGGVGAIDALAAVIGPGALTSRLGQPRAVAEGDSGTVWFVDRPSATSWVVAQVYPGGFVRPFATLDNTYDPRDLVRDPVAGGLVFSSSGGLYRIPAGGGAPTRIAGGGSNTAASAAALDALLNDPRGLAFDPDGNLLFAESGAHRVRMLRPDAQVVPFAGTGTAGNTMAEGGSAGSALLQNPLDVAVDAGSNQVYVLDGGNAKIRRVDRASGLLYTEADMTARYSAPPFGIFFPPLSELAVSGGRLLLSDGDEVFHVQGGTLVLIAGAPLNGIFSSAAEAGQMSRVVLANARGLAPAADGGWYAAANRLVLKMSAADVGSPVAGTPNPMVMGTRALWFGADANSAPGEVSGWVQDHGFGNGWSQRLTSPAFTYASGQTVTLTFDAVLELGNDLGFTDVPGNEALVVEARLVADGSWQPVGGTATEASGTGSPYTYFSGTTAFRFEAPIATGPVASQQFDAVRIRMQSDFALSNEDGNQVGSMGGLLVDNVRLAVDGVDVFPPLTFEDGGTGAWTLSARNGFYGTGADVATQYFTRDGGTVPTAVPQVRSGYDASNSSCVWTFGRADGQLEDGTSSRITSPWLPAGNRALETYFEMSGKLNTTTQAGGVMLWVRAKQAGQQRPAVVAPTFFNYNSGTDGDDAFSPYTQGIRAVFPIDFDFDQALFTNAGGFDSLQLVVQVSDIRETVYGSLPVGNPTTRLPYLDDIRVFQPGGDTDWDGIANGFDACPLVPATGQDADADGCVDPTAALNHVRTWVDSDRPIRYRFSSAGSASIPDDSEILDVRAAFLEWANAVGAAVPVVEEVPTPEVNASAFDGVNLVTFRDPDVAFPPSVLAQTLTTTFTRTAAANDRIVLPGQVVDSDILFNPAASFRTSTRPGTYDLRAVATHEIGHFLGLSHSPVLDATMFYVIQSGAEASSLDSDDLAAIAAAYPAPELATDWGTISGAVRRGSDASPVPGAAVVAVRLAVNGAPEDTVVADYTRENGTYVLRRLEPGNYAVRVDPLDGGARGLTADRINERVSGIAATNFAPEWHSDPESGSDDPDTYATLAVTAGATLADVDIVTNVDVVPPTIVSVTPGDATTGLGIDALVTLAFSEPIAPGTLQSAFRLRAQGTTTALGGIGQLIGGTRFVFAPADPLAFGTTYEIEVNTALTDDEGVPLAATSLTTFTTEPEPPLAITRLAPNATPVGSLMTIEGAGFPADAVSVLGEFSQFDPNVITPLGPAVVGVTIQDSRTALVRVPTGPLTGGFRMIVDGTASNALTFTVLPPPEQAAPVPYGDAVPLVFTPLDIALSPDGATAFAVGSGGLVSVDLTAIPRAAVSHSADAATHVTLTPDGALALVSRPDFARVDVVDAVPTSGTFGQVLQSVEGLAQAGPVVVMPNGRRAHVVFAGSRVAEIDLQASSPTAWQVIADRLYAPVGATAMALRTLAPDPRGSGLLLGVSGNGTARWQFPADSLPPVAGSVAPSDGGLAVAPNGLTAFGLATSSATGFLMTLADGPANSATFGAATPVALAGSPSDVAVAREGQSAFVTNSAFNEMAVVDLLPTSLTLGSIVARVPTGMGPGAVATSALAAVVGVANRSSRTLSFYTYDPAGTPTVRDVQSPVTLPGHLVAVVMSDSLVEAGTQIDVDGQVVTPTNRSVIGASFLAPALSQRTAALAVQQPGGARSLEVPLTIAAPAAALDALDAATRKLTVPGYFCFGDEGSGSAERAVLSPNGKVLAVAAYGRYAECNRMFFFDMDPQGGERLGALLGVFSNSRYFTDWEWTTDSRQIWVAIGNGSSIRIDADPASPTFATAIGNFTTPTNGSPSSVAVDPLGRYIAVSGFGEGAGLTFFNSNGTEREFTDYPDIEGMTITPDGRFLVAPGTSLGALRYIDLGTPGTPIVETTPVAGLVGLSRIAFSPDGRTLAALYGGSNLVLYNLDPAAGPVFDRLFAGQPVGGTPHELTDLVPGPRPGSLVACSSTTPFLFEFDGRTGAVLGQAAVDSATATVVRTPDGRGYWTFPRVEALLPDGFSTEVHFHPTLFTNHGGVSLSLLTPATHVVPTGSQVPIRVKVTGGNGDPQIGVPVRFTVPPIAGGFTLPGDRLTDASGEVDALVGVNATSGSLAITITADGIPGQSHVVTIQIAATSADVPPVIVQFGPADGATGINAGSPVSVRFNQPMQPTSLASALTLTADGAPVAGQLTLADGGRVGVFAPSAPLPYAAACVLTVAPGALDTDGQPLANGGTSSFTVQAAPTLALTALSPPAGPPGAPVSILGTGFVTSAQSHVVTFNGALASVASAEPLLLGTNVPLAAESGPVQVRIGGVTSNELTFTVLSPNPTPGGVIGTLTTSEGTREVEITPDGTRAYCTNPVQNDVTALDMATTSVLTRVPVGLAPQGLAIVPSGRRLYVANQGSDDVSVIDVDPASPQYHVLVNTIPVGDQPVGVAIANQATGVKVVVSNAGDGTLSIIDAEPNNATFEQVTSTATTGTSGKGGNIVITNDGGTAFVATPSGVVTVNLLDGTSKTLATSDAVVDIDITPQGTLVLALLGDGTILVIGAVPGSPDFNRVVATSTTGTSSKSNNIVITNDGALAYVTNPDGGTVLVFQITDTATQGASVALPGAPVTLTLLATIPAGTAPSGIGTDPNGRFLAVTDPATGAVTLIGMPTSLPPIAVEFDFNPNTLNVRSMGRWVTAYIEPPAPWTTDDIDVASLRLEGTVAPDPEGPVGVGDHDGDGIPDLAVKFPRSEIALLLPEGDAVPVHLTGTIGPRLLTGQDAIKVKRIRILSPLAGSWTHPGTGLNVTWERPKHTESMKVTVIWSRDHGVTWEVLATNLLNVGYYGMTTPNEIVDSARVAVAIVESGDPLDGDFTGYIALSDYFTIASGPLSVPPPAVLSFARPGPNPAVGRTSLRFGLPEKAPARLEVYDVRGRRVRTLLDGERAAGWHVVEWNGDDASGRPAGAGVYFVRLTAGGRRLEHRLTLLR